MQAEPFSGVTVPLDVEAVAADAVEAGEGGVELFTGDSDRTRAEVAQAESDVRVPSLLPAFSHLS